MVTKGREGPLKADIVLLSVLILHELLVLLVDGVISQMHVFVVLIEFGRIRF